MLHNVSPLPSPCGTEVTDALGVDEVGVVVAVVVVVGNSDDGIDIHPTIDELTPPSLTATAIPATISKRQNTMD